jgi:hypothetical protein
LDLEPLVIFAFFCLNLRLNQEKRNRGKGISETEGKGAQGSAERDGSRASFNPISVIQLLLQAARAIDYVSPRGSAATENV